MSIGRDCANGSSQYLDFKLDCPDLMVSERMQLENLLTQFADLFACKGGPVGRTSTVKHKGPMVRQPVWRVPEKLKGVVDVEVEKMLEQNIVRPSSNPW